MPLHTSLCKTLDIRFPMIMAPMFLVSNQAMLEAAMKNGIAGAFPSLNFRKENELEDLLDALNKIKAQYTGGTYGINLIVQQTNPLYAKHLEICVAKKVPFYITSLGNPKQVIERAHAYGGKVFCDVTNLEHAQKCASLGCDGFIAVGQGAGGHAGPYPLHILVPALLQNFPDIPVVAAGGIASGSGILAALATGAAGVSIGTRFIASTEAGVSNEYKQAIVDAGMKDIVLTEKISGTPCTIINTPYAQKIGYKQNWFERKLSNSPRTKKWFKTLVQLRGFRRLERAVKPGNYANLWCAGQSAELIGDIKPCEQIIQQLCDETYRAHTQLEKMFGEA